MLVFDPLAIALFIAANFAFEKLKDEDGGSENKKPEKKHKKENKKEEMKELVKKIWEFLPKFKRKNKTATKEENEIGSITDAISSQKESPFISVSDIIKEEPKDNIQVEEIKESEEDKYNREMEEYRRRRAKFRNNPSGEGPSRLR